MGCMVEAQVEEQPYWTLARFYNARVDDDKAMVIARWQLLRDWHLFRTYIYEGRK